MVAISCTTKRMVESLYPLVNKQFANLKMAQSKKKQISLLKMVILNMVIFHFVMSTRLLNGHFRNQNWRYLPYMFGLFFSPFHFRGKKPSIHMAVYIWYLLTYLQSVGSWRSPIELSEANGINHRCRISNHPPR